MKRLLLVALAFLLLLSGCSADDPLTEDVYSSAGVHAGSGFFTTLIVDGVAVMGGSGASAFTDLADVPSAYTRCIVRDGI